MNIGELARQAEVTPRTIRYYVEQGLLPPPERGYPAEYTEEHAERLELIKLLKEERVSLEEIKSTVSVLSDDEVKELLAQARERAKARPVEEMDSAANYIARVLEGGANREQSILGQARKRGITPPVMEPQSVPGGRAEQVPPQAPYAPPLPAAQPDMAKEMDAVDAPVQDAGTWQRIQVTPGVEIHYQVAADEKQRNLVDRLVELAARLLGRGPEKEG